ncbi:hypothetical protein A1O1_05206 [Capronia coronata CBS 617.96]|uniref:Zn(2)-C6 fungal-type domain-containing protein n=1 Tax=Capronia coronata CBS 617.96 TaxID=1182541 RepID=W9YG82_9EURO|nr:uncharacterized protein A1O1_05206 [Capronia coronata CBS 617.96]EXJ88276.1 hypothetical protein A1O1_05206 [Capronia coronata CBS 617.96]
MHPEQDRTRTRPRVSRACERCRVKKAKCDGEKPCKRCNLDKAVCSYKVRRRTESGGSNQRYAGLLIQHHAALTAGLIELYTRIIKGQPWEGSPVDELNGSPSVHCILERLGVIDAEDEIDPTPTADPRLGSDLGSSSNGIKVAADAAREQHQQHQQPPPSKVRKLSKSTTTSTSTATSTSTSTTRKISQSNRRSNSSRSPRSKTSPALAPAPVASSSSSSLPTSFPQSQGLTFDTEDRQQATIGQDYFNHAVSPPSSAGTISSWESQSHAHSPDLADDMFTTPLPTTPTTTSESYFPDYQIPTTQQAAYAPFSASTVVDGSVGIQGYVGRESIPTPVQAGAYTSPETAAEACTAGYFLDATGGMGLYGWDTGNVGGGGGGNVGFGSLQQECNAWDSGVFV